MYTQSYIPYAILLRCRLLHDGKHMFLHLSQKEDGPLMNTLDWLCGAVSSL